MRIFCRYVVFRCYILVLSQTYCRMLMGLARARRDSRERCWVWLFVSQPWDVGGGFGMTRFVGMMGRRFRGRESVIDRWMVGWKSRDGF